MQGGIAHPAVVVPQGGLIALYLVPHITQPALQLQHIAQLRRLREDLQQPLLLQAQGLQPGLGIGIAFGHIRHIGAAAHHIAQLTRRAHRRFQLVGRYPRGDAGVPGVIAAAV